jgi:hypothetical protein
MPRRPPGPGSRRAARRGGRSAVLAPQLPLAVPVPRILNEDPLVVRHALVPGEPVTAPIASHGVGMAVSRSPRTASHTSSSPSLPVTTAWPDSPPGPASGLQLVPAALLRRVAQRDGRVQRAPALRVEEGQHPVAQLRIRSPSGVSTDSKVLPCSPNGSREVGAGSAETGSGKDVMLRRSGTAVGVVALDRGAVVRLTVGHIINRAATRLRDQHPDNFLIDGYPNHPLLNIVRD